jgi:hypothetical protein
LLFMLFYGMLWFISPHLAPFCTSHSSFVTLYCLHLSYENHQCTSKG